jgi:CheY-like chemotaxis protein
MSWNIVRPAEILLVEDNQNDVLLTRRAFQQGRVLNNLSVTRDGVEAMDFLHRRNQFADAPRPDLILLDLNMPRKDGREVLAEIKSDDDLKHIPVVVLTTSEAEQDVLASYQLHANCYIVKPVDLGQFINALLKLEDFWLNVVKLPSAGDS